MRFRLYADHLRDSHAKFSLVMAFNTLLSVLLSGWRAIASTGLNTRG